jgi:hypothetical protein
MTANREALVDRNKRLAHLAAERVVARIDTYRERLGIRPWEGPELTPDESMRAFAEIVDDPVAWAKLVEAERQLFHLTPDRVPKRLWREATAMFEKMKTKGVPPEENDDGTNA